jgi:hypothetical protein
MAPQVIKILVSAIVLIGLVVGSLLTYIPAPWLLVWWLFWCVAGLIWIVSTKRRSAGL